jgi:hypothetical protein
MYTYSAPAMSLATNGYSWTLPSGVTALGPSNANTISLQFPSNFTSGQLCVRGNSSCGAGYDRCVQLTGNPATPGSIIGSASVCPGSTEIYTWPSVAGASQYQVMVPAGATVVSGGTTSANTAVVQWGSTAGNVTVKAINGCGVSGSRTYAVGISCRTTGVIRESFETTIFPNPAHDKINVQFNGEEEEVMELVVTDLSGRVAMKLNLFSNYGDNFHELDLTGITPGMYLLSLKGTVNGNSLKTIVVQ